MPASILSFGRWTALLIAALVAIPASAQTTDAVALLGRPCALCVPTALGSGMAHVRITDNSSPGTDVIVVRGQFRGLTSDYVSSELRIGDAPAITLQAGLADDNRFGGWGADLNTFTVTDELTAALLNGQVRVVITTADAPASDISGGLSPLSVVIDGSAAESAYRVVATKENANMGFGPDADVTSTRVRVEQSAGVVVLAVTGRLNTASSDGIGLLVGGDGVAVGTSLGGTPNAGHFLGAAEHPNFKADFQVGVGFALNSGNGTENAFLDVVQYVSRDGTGRRADYLGAAPQDGRLAIGPVDPTANDGMRTPPLPDVAFAFRNDGAEASGFELVVPITDLGIPIPVARRGGGAVALSAFVVSSTAFFSNVTVPGNVAGDNLGFDPDFATLDGGPFSASGGFFTSLSESPSGASALRLVGPNPTASRARLVLTLAASEALRVDLIDALGRTVAVLHDGPAPAGETTLTADASSLPAGVYAVRVAGETVRASQRLTVVR